MLPQNSLTLPWAPDRVVPDTSCVIHSYKYYNMTYRSIEEVLAYLSKLLFEPFYLSSSRLFKVPLVHPATEMDLNSSGPNQLF